MSRTVPVRRVSGLMPLPEAGGEQLSKEQISADGSAQAAGWLLLPLQNGAVALQLWGWSREKVVEQGRWMLMLGWQGATCICVAS